MEDIADLGLSAVEYGVDKYHDRFYDKAQVLPGKIKSIKRRKSKTETDRDGNSTRFDERRESIEIDDYDPTLRRQQDRRQQFRQEQAQRGPQQPGRNRRNMSIRDDGYGSDGGYSRGGRSGRGLDRDTYDPEQAGMRGYAGRDGYAPYTPAYAGGAAYDAAERGEGNPRYLENGSVYDNRRRSYEQSRRGGYDDEDDYEEEDERSRGGKELQRRRRSDSRGTSRPGSQRGEHGEGKGKEELQKWGATLAGAAIGAYGGRVATGKHGQSKDNWMPTAIGAVVGGLIAREAEKELSKRKQHKQEERREEEEAYSENRRSRSGTRDY